MKPFVWKPGYRDGQGCTATYYEAAIAWSNEQADELEAGLQVGDTVKVNGPECQGLVGELKVIDEHNDDEGDFFGIEFDTIEGYVFFRSDELERVEKVDLAELPF